MLRRGAAGPAGCQNAGQLPCSCSLTQPTRTVALCAGVHIFHLRSGVQRFEWLAKVGNRSLVPGSAGLLRLAQN